MRSAGALPVEEGQHVDRAAYDPVMTGNTASRPHPTVLRMLHQDDVIGGTRDVEVFRRAVVFRLSVAVNVSCNDTI